MRLMVIGLLCALLGVALAPTGALAAGIDAGMKTKGMAAAPGLVQRAGLDCQPVSAAQLGQQQDPKTHATSTIVEIACKDREGFLVVDHGAAAAPDAYTCLEMSGAAGGNLKCSLPENANPAQGLQSLVSRGAAGCQVAKARVLGHAPKETFFEVACQNGDGYVMETADTLSGKAPTVSPCLAFLSSNNIKCTLSDTTAQLARVDQLAAQSDKPCQVKDRRYILTSEDNNNFYEVACQDGKGYVLQQGPDGKLAKTISCANADYIGGGCTLTNARQAQSEEAGIYTALAKKAGFDCAVSKYSPFEVANPGHEVVELACSNRPDGAIGVFPASGSEPGKILPCGPSELAGYRCGLTPQAAGYSNLTAALRKLGKTTCDVSSSRVVGLTADKQDGLIEVGCSDGKPGFLLDYAVASLTPKEATACTFAGKSCTLPGNTSAK